MKDIKMADKYIKVIIDTNIWISFLIGKHLKGLQNYLNNESIRIITCHEQLIELTEVLNKPKIKKYIKPYQIEEFLDLIYEVSEVVKISLLIDICRDKKDNYLLSLAKCSDSDYLITGDDDLLVLDGLISTKILKYSEFEMILHS